MTQDPTSTPPSPPPTDPVTARVNAACDAIGDIIEYWGFKKVQGRVWAYLVLAGAPRHQVEIAEALGISRALVSQTIAELTERELVRSTEDRRNAPVEASLDVWPTVSEILRSREWMLLETARAALEDVRAELEWQPEEQRRFSPEAVARVLSIVEVVQSLLRAIMTLRRPEPEAEQVSWMTRASRLITQLRRQNP